MALPCGYLAFLVFGENENLFAIKRPAEQRPTKSKSGTGSSFARVNL